MREIKFRAWDKKYNKWLAKGFTLLGEVTCFDLIGMSLQELEPKTSTLERLNDVVLQQYTGQKDKKGREIYEGDVLDNDNVVLWSNEQSCFFCGQVPLCMSNSHREIIGNIHQNPELLK